MKLKSLATVEEYKRYNRVDNTTSVGSSSKNFDGNKTNESDEEIQLYLDAASQTIRNFVGNDFTLAIYTETQFSQYSGRYRTINPIKKILSVDINGMSLKVEDFKFYGNMIVSNYFSSGNSVIKYVGGDEDVPSDIIQSTIHLASNLSRKKTRIGVQSVTNGDSTTTYQTVSLPEDIKLVLENYRSWITPGNIVIEREIYNG